jgi:hypothetical protein
MWQEQGAKKQGPFGNIIYMKIQQSWNKMAKGGKKKVIETWENICMIIYLLLTLPTIFEICKKIDNYITSFEGKIENANVMLVCDHV